MLLAIERSGGRVARYVHNVERMMNVPQHAAALLAVLMLRGPQTAGELRMNCERLHSFADIERLRRCSAGVSHLFQLVFLLVMKLNRLRHKVQRHHFQIGGLFPALLNHRIVDNRASRGSATETHSLKP
jgi:uncharacterized protein YceH (UPF0502 family)